MGDGTTTTTPSDVNVLNLYTDTSRALMDSFHSYWDSQLNSIYQRHFVYTPEGAFNIFHSFTYGEMVISFLLFCILMVMVFKWIYEVIS